MTAIKEVLGACIGLLYSAGEFVGWLTQPISPLFQVTPLFLISFSGLITFLGLAIAKWFTH